MSAITFGFNVKGESLLKLLIQTIAECESFNVSVIDLNTFQNVTLKRLHRGWVAVRRTQ